MYSEDEFLQLSGIQHFAFCRRQWAMIHLEMQWSENLRTVEGKILHDKAHDSFLSEIKKGVIVSRGMPIQSKTLGVSGECDIVEFRPCKNGISLHGKSGTFQPVPVEYKRGKPKENDIDIVQLAAQAICLEEMLCCEIPDGYFYYGETRRRQKVAFDSEIRCRVLDICKEMHHLYDRKHTPIVKRTKSCNACSIKDLCLPVLAKKKNVAEYISTLLCDTE